MYISHPFSLAMLDRKSKSETFSCDCGPTFRAPAGAAMKLASVISVDSAPPIGSRTGISRLVPLTIAATTGSGNGNGDGFRNGDRERAVELAVSQALQKVMRRHANRGHAAVGKRRLHAGNLSHKDLFQRIGRVADEELDALIDRQQRVIQPLQVLVGESDLDTVAIPPCPRCR